MNSNPRQNLVLFTLLILLTLPLAARAQSNPMPPAIAAFTSDTVAVRLDAVEAGEATVTLSWQVLNFDPAAQRLDIEALQFNAWQVVQTPNDALPAVGSRQVKVVLPYSFGPPTFRLALKDRHENVFDQRFVTLAYETPIDLAPRIESFLTDSPAVDTSALANGSARIPVTWNVIDRPPTANLVFEQILEDGRHASVELPRRALWVDSQGQGVVSPTTPAGSQVELSLAVVDMVSGEVYAEARLNIPLSGALRRPVQPVATPVPPTQNPNLWFGAQVVSLTASPIPADPTGTVTISWEVRGVESVRIAWLTPVYDPNSGYVPDERAGLPPQGSLTVDLRGVWFNNSDAVVFDLYIPAPADASPEFHGWIYTGDITVKLKHNMVARAFSATPASARRGDTVTLSWDVANAVSVQILGLEGGDPLPPSGSMAVTIPQEVYVDSMNYDLWATDANGVTMSDVQLRIPLLCSYTSQYADVCPYTQRAVDLVYQPFEHGQMFWNSETRQITVLYADGRYEVFSDTWTPGEAVNITDIPPAPLLAPERGFGKLWAGEPRVRQTLGWATAAEMAYSTPLETVIESVFRFPAFGTYLRLPGGSAVHLLGTENRWEVVG